MVLNGKFSKWVEVYAGVPQGSILGPLLFLICINDIAKHIGGTIRLFAADTSLNIIIDLPEQAARVLNADLQTVFQWANAVQMVGLFNLTQTKPCLWSFSVNYILSRILLFS